MELLRKQEAICRELGNQEGLQVSYGNQALILQDWGRALRPHQRARKHSPRIYCGRVCGCEQLSGFTFFTIEIVRNQAASPLYSVPPPRTYRRQPP